jgi:hypothetical protein
MNETNQVKKNIKKNKKPEIILEKNIHSIVLFYGISFSLFVLYYSFFLHKIPFFISIFILFIIFFLTYYNYYGRKVVITKNKFYIYRLNKKIISLSYAKDFLYINYEKTKLGILLNYGTILLVTQKNLYYKIYFIKDPEKIFFTAIYEYENVMKIINPQYKRKFLKEPIKNENYNFNEEFEKIED